MAPPPSPLFNYQLYQSYIFNAYYCYTVKSSIPLSKSLTNSQRSFKNLNRKCIFYSNFTGYFIFTASYPQPRGLRFAQLRSTPARGYVDVGKNDVKIVIIWVKNTLSIQNFELILSKYNFLRIGCFKLYINYYY